MAHDNRNILLKIRRRWGNWGPEHAFPTDLAAARRHDTGIKEDKSAIVERKEDPTRWVIPRTYRLP